jgi:aminodeoxyfutalosine synthase
LSRKALAMQVLHLERHGEIRDPFLEGVARKIEQGGRLDLDDGLGCLHTWDLVGLGKLALAKRKAIHGMRATFIRNLHLNYTNICANQCTFCAFHRTQEAPDGFLLGPDEAARRVCSSPVEPLREVHVVGGCHPGLDMDYYVGLIRALKQARPQVRVKAFTAVEVDHMASRAGIPAGECLLILREAGLDVLPGGGAEVFSGRLRDLLFPKKTDAHRWLQIHGEAHGLGIPTNATLLFGHMETQRERVEHLLRLREQQDRTGGFQAFIPLPFQSRNTPLSHLRGPTGVEILKLMATSRLVLDNFPSIKAYWVMLGTRLTQVALHFGADDLEGTIVHEQIAHEAGAKTERGLSVEQLRALIQEAGFEPVERDSFHNPIAQELQ